MKAINHDLELLLIEDNPADMFLIREMLQSSTLKIKNIYETDRLEEAKWLLETKNIHIALLDLTLPDGFGINSLLGIRSFNKKIPVIILTGTNDADLAMKAIQQGAQDYLVKGEFNSNLLTRSIRHCFERARSTEQLRQSNERLLFHLENSPLGFIEWNGNRQIKYWSRRAAEIFGWKQKKIMEKYREGFSLVYEEDRPQVDLYARQLLEGRSGRNSMQCRNYTHDGRVIWCEWYNSVQRDSGGRVVSILSLVQDITERKNAEQLIQKSEERYRQMVETAQEGIWFMDEFNLTDFANQKMAAILGYSLSELVSIPFLDLVAPESRPVAERLLAQRAALGWGDQDFELLTREGSTIWAKIAANPIYDGSGAYKGLLAMVTEITDNKLAAARIRESEEKYRQMFNRNPFPSMILDLASLQILEVNQSAIDKYGYSREEFLKMTISDIRPPENQASSASLFRPQANRRGQQFLMEHKMKNGEVLMMEVSYYPIPYYGKTAMQAQMNDVTERMLLENALEVEKENRRREITAAVLEAQEKERIALGEELHDNINQIITSVRLYVDLARKKKRNIDILLKASLEYIDLAIEENRKLAKSLILPQLKGIGLLVSLEELKYQVGNATSLSIKLSTQGFDEDDFTEKQKISVYRIVQEQLNNIIKHAQAKKVLIGLIKDADSLQLVITDDGVGFDPQLRSKGLGLTNMRSRAEVLHAELEIRSAPGEGCTLRMKIPLS